MILCLPCTATAAASKDEVIVFIHVRAQAADFAASEQVLLVLQQHDAVSETFGRRAALRRQSGGGRESLWCDFGFIFAKVLSQRECQLTVRVTLKILKA